MPFPDSNISTPLLLIDCIANETFNLGVVGTPESQIILNSFLDYLLQNETRFNRLSFADGEELRKYASSMDYKEKKKICFALESGSFDHQNQSYSLDIRYDRDYIPLPDKELYNEYSDDPNWKDYGLIIKSGILQVMSGWASFILSQI